MSTTIERPVNIPEIDIPVISDEEAQRREILLGAAAVIEQYGHTTGSDGMTLDGPFCLLGAVSKSMDASTYVWKGEVKYGYSEAAILLSGIPGDDGWHSSQTFYRWNDIQKFIKRERKGFFKGRVTAGERTCQVLRRMANGQTWEQATSDTRYPSWYTHG